MRILGIDPSLSGLGWCVLEGKGTEWEVRDWGVYSHPSVKVGESPGPRLEYFWWSLNEVCMKNRPDLAGIEGDILGTINPRTTVQLAQLGGVIRLLLQFRGVRWVEWIPSQWKLFLFGIGNGNVKKVGVPERLEKLYGLEIRDFDLAEATAVAIATWEEHQGRARKVSAVRQRGR